MITIYEKGAVDFGNNGLGTLNPISCTVTETLNGNYEVVLTHPIDEAGKYARIQEERIIKVPVPAGRTPRISAGVGTGTLRIYKIVTDGRRLYLRAAPSSSAKGIKTYKPGTEVVVIDNETNDKWSEVETPDGKHGWMWTGNLSYVRTEVTNDAADSIKESEILREQPFRIYKVEPTLTTVTAYARHIFYDLMDNMVSEYKPTKTTTGAAAFIGLAGATEDGHGFTFYSDLDSTAEEVEITDKNPAEAILGDGGLVENYGGELARDWWDVYLVKRVGEETGIQIREGKNLLGIKYSVDITNCATRIIPKGADKDGKPLYLPEKWIDNTAADKAAYINHKYSVLEVKDAKEKTKGDDKRTKEECYAMMRKAAEDAFREGADLPDVTLNVDFIDCAETEEYRQYRNLQGIHMGDTVRVVARRVGVEVSMRMTQYSYNCLTKRYEKMTLGTIDATIDGNMINPRSIGSGTIKGSMIKLGGIGSGQIEDGAVNGLKIALAAIEYAHIGTAAIDQLSANAITAIRANIRELVAGNITTDQLYADLAVIAAAQITAANIEKANIQWAQIENLSAEIAKVVNAEIENLEVDWAGIYEADIEWANITNLTAEIAKITAAEIGKAKINWAQIVDVKIGTADIEDATITSAKIALGAITSALIKAGAIGTAQIADGSITSAKIVELSADVIKSGTLSTDRLLIKGAGGLFYEINATAGGLTSTQLTQEQYKNAISGTALVARSVTADKIAAKTITANEILSGTITAAEINVANLFAADATIAALNNYILRTQTIEAIEGKLDVWASDKINLAVDNLQIGGRNYILGTGTPYTAVGTGSRQWLYPWHCASIAANRSLYGKTVTISFDYEEAITSGSLGVIVNDLWIGVKSFDSDTGSGHFTLTREHADFNTGSDVFIYIDGTWTGSVTFSNVKVEIGNKETDWTPAPEDADAAIAELSAAISIQAGEITSNATKIETVSQAAGNAQDTADAAQNAASSAQSAASGAVTRVTKAEERISAVEGSITSKVSKTEFDELGRLVSEQETKIEQTDEQVLILAGRRAGGTQLLKNGGFYGGLSNWSKLEHNVNGEYRELYYEPVSPNDYRANEVPNLVLHAQNETGMFGATQVVKGLRKNTQYTISGYVASHRSNRVGIEIRDTTASRWAMNPVFDVGWGGTNLSAYNRFEYTFDTGDYSDYQITLYSNNFQDNAYVWWAQVKLEEGNTATAWSPHPDDPASGVDAGGVVRVDQTGVHMSGGTIEMETSDGDEYIHIRNDGISASSLSAPDVTPRYSGPGMLYVNPNATSEQIAKGDTFRSLADALAKLRGRWLGKDVTIYMAAGMTEYSTPVLTHVYGGNITINGNGVKLVGGLALYNGGSKVTIDNLDVDMTGDAGFSADNWTKMVVQNCVITGTGSGYGVYSTNGASVTVNNSEIYDCSRSLFGIAGGEIDGYACKGNCRVGANRTTLYLHDSMPCDVTTWTPSLWAGQVLTANISVDQGSKPTPIPAPTTAVYDLLHADSYAAGNVNSWVYPEGKPNDDIYQGYTGQAGRICGCMWFDNAAIRSALSGKTIRQASIRLTAQRYVGYGREVTVYLRGTATSYSGRNGPPALTTDYGIIGTAEPAVTGTFTIPAQAISDMASGAIEGLVLYHQDTADMQGKNYSRNYMRFDGSTSGDAETRPRLTVVYQ